MAVALSLMNKSFSFNSLAASKAIYKLPELNAKLNLCLKSFSK